MNKPTLFLLATLASPFAMAQSAQCNYSLDYTIEVSDSKIQFTDRNDRQVAFYADHLSVDGKTLVLTQEQAKTREEFTELSRQMVPKVVEVAIDGAELGVKAATLVVSAFFGDDPQAHQELVEPISRVADKIRANVSPNRIDTHALDASLNEELEVEIEALVENALSKYAGRMVGQVFDAVFSSDDEQTKDFSNRMAQMEKDLDLYIDKEAKAIEKKADALCVDFKQLAKLDESLESVPGYPDEGLIQQGSRGNSRLHFSRLSQETL